MERLASFWIVIACPPVLGFGRVLATQPIVLQSPMGRDKRSNQVPASKTPCVSDEDAAEAKAS